MPGKPTLAQELGYSANTKLVIFACDDLGYSPSVNEGILGAVRAGVGTTASLMTICPSTDDAVRSLGASDDVGVHLTLNCDFESDRWTPLTKAPSITDAEGFLRPHPRSLLPTMLAEEVYRECCAQIDHALDRGVDVTHIDAHQNSFLYSDTLGGIYFRLASQYALPLRRLRRYRTLRVAGRPIAKRRYDTRRAMRR